PRASPSLSTTYLFCLCFLRRRPPTPPLFPHTTLFRSVFFHGRGDVTLAIRASCSYPGLFQPLNYEGKLLVDGGMSMEVPAPLVRDRKSTRLNSSHGSISYAVFCLKKKKTKNK